ncbi:MAG: hypothetical protein EOP05_22330, partial [Proteobacteria bacterium]
PVQITSDLASFWKTGYPEVRKELRLRYPKHSWPEDPFTAKRCPSPFCHPSRHHEKVPVAFLPLIASPPKGTKRCPSPFCHPSRHQEKVPVAFLPPIASPRFDSFAYSVFEFVT